MADAPSLPDAVTDFAWEPRGDKFVIVTSNDPNLGNVAPGITIKTEISFYQPEASAVNGKFKLLSTCRTPRATKS